MLRLVFGGKNFNHCFPQIFPLSHTHLPFCLHAELGETVSQYLCRVPAAGRILNLTWPFTKSEIDNLTAAECDALHIFYLVAPPDGPIESITSRREAVCRLLCDVEAHV